MLHHFGGLEACACRDDSTVASSAQREREAAADNSGSGDEAQVSHTPVPSVFLCMREQVHMPLHSISDRTVTYIGRHAKLGKPTTSSQFGSACCA